MDWTGADERVTAADRTTERTPGARSYDSIKLLVKKVYIDPSTFTDLFCTFSGCSHMTTIYADSTWALPSSGISGSQCFYSCSTSLVGGNGTACASSKTAYTYFRIDTASTPGYITAV